MGMDYQYAGSASYPRFNSELSSVAAIFGGIETKTATEKQLSDYGSEYINSAEQSLPRFIFPVNTNETLIRWFNDPYGDFDEKETDIIWNHIKQHEEIKQLSKQIWDELRILTEHSEPWYIS